jgi:arabinosyltransferase
MGKGFPVASVPPEEADTVLIFATGTGIAPIKAVIESGALEADKRKDVRLYFGCSDNDSSPYKELCAPVLCQGRGRNSGLSRLVLSYPVLDS